MTITYTVSPLHGGFFSLLFRWKGSVWKHIWKKLLTFLVLYAAVSLIYHLLFNKTQRAYFARIANGFNAHTKRIPLTFLLGFYVNQVIRRWYDQYNQITKPDQFMIVVSSIIRGPEEKTRVIRRTIARYINLACVMVWRKIALRTKKRFPKDWHLIQAGLMTEDEKEEYDRLSLPYSSQLLPLMWIVNLVGKCMDDGLITDFQLARIIGEVKAVRSQLGALQKYEWITIPLIYTQVATLATYGYFLICIIGRQYVGEEPDLYVPFYTMLEFVFYMGWLQVAEDLLNPFGEDDEDFEMNYIVDKNVQNSFNIADTLCGRIGAVNEDKFWNEQVIKLPHTKASSKVVEHLFPGNLTRYRLTEAQMELVDKDLAMTDKPELTLRERIRDSKVFDCINRDAQRVSSPNRRPKQPKPDRTNGSEATEHLYKRNDDHRV